MKERTSLQEERDQEFIGLCNRATGYGELLDLLGTSDKKSLKRRMARVEKRTGIPLKRFSTPPSEKTRSESIYEAKIRGLNQQIQELKTLNKHLALGVARSEDYVQLIHGATRHNPSPPSWMDRPLRQSHFHGTPTLFLSDLHWDEIVHPPQVNYCNEFHREIAIDRLHRVFDTTVYLLKDIMRQSHYDGIVVALGGDMMSGYIHEELRENQSAPLLAGVLHLFDELVAGIDKLKREFGRIFLPCVVGNHGRLDQKIRAKNGVFDNVDWLLYQLLARHYSDESDITFFIPDSTDAYYRLYDVRYMLTHGNQFRGGSGISGPYTPWTLGDHKKRKRQNAIKQSYDTLIFGHFHMLTWGSGNNFICNGCFPEGSKVSTPSGFTEIQKVQTGDEVLSRDGSIQTVSYVFEKRSDHGLVHLTVRGVETPLSVTPNHLVWSIKSENRHNQTVDAGWEKLRGRGDEPQWIPADFLSPGDYVNIPKIKGDSEEISEDLSWAFGLYIARGSTLLDTGRDKIHNRLQMTMHKHELPILERVAYIFEQEFGIHSRVFHQTRKNGGKTSELTCTVSHELAIQFRDWLGQLGRKHVPDFAYSLTPRLKKRMVEGWVDGDGHITIEGVMSATTVSSKLAHQMFQLALDCGMLPSILLLTPKSTIQRNSRYILHFNKGQESLIINDEVFYRVDARYRDREVVPVYDLEVSGEHTYCVNHVGVHNSLKGMDEWAFSMNFPFERPKQALWITHPSHGITMKLDVFGDDDDDNASIDEWVSLPRK